MLYQADADVAQELPGGFSCIEETTLRGLERNIIGEEVSYALKSMGAFKAPGKDGERWESPLWGLLPTALRSRV
ncbi:unnamed protein product [Linum trigynum]|uniref:Uncharacterized protein n=1 Tax=Linum trigynum TaxID=586398 RepID=A0AAV2E8B4_9ROSI